MPNIILGRGLEVALRVLAERTVSAGIAREKLSGTNQKPVAVKESLMVEKNVVCGLFQRVKHGC